MNVPSEEHKHAAARPRRSEKSTGEATAIQRADAYLQAGLVSDAADLYASAVRDEGSLGARQGLARCAYLRRQLHEAASQLQLVLAADPHFPHAANDLGVVYFELGLFQEAHEQLLEAACQVPDDPLIWRNLVDVTHQMGDTASCMEYCRRVLRVQPHDDAVKELLTLLETPSTTSATPG